MFKFFLVCILIGYALYKIATIKISSPRQQGFQPPKPDGQTRTSNQTPPKPKGSNFKGGEYVDYEEIK